MIRNTAILVFTRTASEEAAAKQWLSFTQKKKNFSIAHYLIGQTIAKARATQLPVYVIESTQQHGNGFGERFTNAIADIFHKGFDSVISMGTDCPGITTELLLKTHHYLQEQQVVIGPDKRGGIYLLGLHKNHFDSVGFPKFSWQTPVLKDEVVEYMRGMDVRVNTLAPLHDFHHQLQHPSDRKLQDVVGAKCCAYLFRLLAECIRPFIPSTKRVRGKEIPSTSLTSPPLRFATVVC